MYGIGWGLVGNSESQYIYTSTTFIGVGNIDSLTHQVLYDCHIHKKLFNLLDFLKISLHFINMINGKLEYILSQLFLSIHSQRLHAIIKFNTCVFYFLFK